MSKVKVWCAIKRGWWGVMTTLKIYIQKTNSNNWISTSLMMNVYENYFEFISYKVWIFYKLFYAFTFYSLIVYKINSKFLKKLHMHVLIMK